MSSNQTPHFTNKTFAEAFDEIYKLACELYRYAESFHPL